MARKPTLSPSKISTYLTCPVRYKWTYIDERGRWYMRARSHFSFGTSLHRVLQRFHDSGDSGVESVHQAVAALEDSWIEAGYGSAQEMQEALSEGKSIVANYVEHAQATPSDARVLFVEKQLRADLGEFVLIGRLDRVDEYDDLTLEVVDYKSGRMGVTDEEVEFDLAMSCYQLLLKAHFPDQPVRARIIALRSGSSGMATLSPEKLEEFKNDLVQLGLEILHRDFESIVPVYKPMCPNCDFFQLCTKHPEFEVPASEPSGDA
ncbi:MAG: PD-(D/E)XK nuclease family protein [Armatimonadetes bacterium]|nr:PD-(D/E)XK nuclease family protein [Armatimonadota bacterium]